ncbi:conserved hypothetical protein [Neospora caninum Liverpool]|uniref:CRAL-TRIO domain-containing protein n=1 Tax=Neospora caninum (strain Liverpool) TaxID=572307 RepID=F0V9M1_NEOCL|nr:conserved hypothetical protein [Neospora caninum Liverpool]CBZ50447.1 conserved hypothetical protein [Neospora caninum Liverpool]CEL65056.1 TPA: hypothetical protein BN1204_009160 [Neospora caninum Liverpool]|eukprot:XP_003880480.1 conserved hypothetical protein [Neospora caninum Liverpool]
MTRQTPRLRLRLLLTALAVFSICAGSAAETAAANGEQSAQEAFGTVEPSQATAESWAVAFGPRGTAKMQRDLRYSLPPRPDLSSVNREVYKIAKNPPHDFWKLASAVPFTFYLPDKDGSYVVFIQLDKMNLDVIKAVPSGQIVDFIKYMGCLFFGTLDGRRDARIKIVMDCGSMNLTSLMWYGGLGTVRAIAHGIDDLKSLLGERTSHFVIINSSSIVQTVVEPLKRFSPTSMTVLALGGPEEYVPHLQELIGTDSLPKLYGGTATVPIGQSPMALAVEQQIRSFIAAKESRRKARNKSQ